MSPGYWISDAVSVTTSRSKRIGKCVGDNAPQIKRIPDFLRALTRQVESSLVKSIRSTLVAVFLAFLVSTTIAWGKNIGVITETEGSPELIRDGDVFAAAAGVEVHPGDLLRTSPGSSAQIELDDGSVLNAAESSELLISDYKLAPDRSVDRAVVGLLSGWLRFITAALRPDARYEIATRTATIGIRGTEGIVHEGPDAVSLELIEGQVDVSEVTDSNRIFPAIRVGSGEFYRRAPGQRGLRTKKPGAAFRTALPPRLKRSAQRRKTKTLRGRAPRKLRNLRQSESQTLLSRHPRFRTRLKANVQHQKQRSKDNQRRHRAPVKSPRKPGAPPNKKQGNNRRSPKSRRPKQ